MGLTVALADGLDHFGDWGLLATDAELVVTRWNWWLEAKSGIAAESVVGRALFDVFPELVSRRLDSYYRQALAGQTVILSQLLHKYVIPLQVPLGDVNTGLMQQMARIVPLVDGSSVRGTLTVIEDVTERVTHEAALRSRAEELANKDRRKDEFLAMLAHELRNPLAPVRNSLQILRTKYTGDPFLDQMGDMMSRQVGHMTRLVDDLLDASRISRGQVQLKRERVELATIVARGVEASRSLIDLRGHELSTSLPPEPIYLDADPVRLTQVVGNLLNNAAKYTDPGGRIWLTAHREGDEVLIGVRDTGIGIPEEMLPRVFDLFTQVDPTLDRSQGGLGIGLTLVHTLVEMHGGTVSVTSDGPGAGSEFFVRLPVLPEESDGGERQPTAGKAAVVPRRILIVDDNVDAADSLAMLLNLVGHEVWTAYDGSNGILAAVEHRPQVVLLDIGLPRMDGYEVARRLRQDPRTSGVTLVAMTGYGQPEDRRRTGEAGFDHHLVKPADLNELAELLAQPVKRSGD